MQCGILKGLTLGAVMTLGVLAQAVQARPNFNYLGVGYAVQRIDGSCNHSGLALEASLVTNELWFIQAQHRDLTSSAWCGYTSTSAGAGVRLDAGRASRVYLSGNAIRRDYGPDVDWGAGVTGGFRTRIASGTEVHGYVHQEWLDALHQTFTGLEINYGLSRDFSVRFGGAVSNEKTREGYLGLRLNF